MNANSSTPMTILVHQELSVPSKVMMRLDHAQHEHAEHGADHVPGAAGQQRAADDDGGDRVEFHADRVQRRRRTACRR